MSNECCLKRVYFIYFIETSYVIYLLAIVKLFADTTELTFFSSEAPKG